MGSTHLEVMPPAWPEAAERAGCALFQLMEAHSLSTVTHPARCQLVEGESLPASCSCCSLPEGRDGSRMCLSLCIATCGGTASLHAGCSTLTCADAHVTAGKQGVSFSPLMLLLVASCMFSGHMNSAGLEQAATWWRCQKTTQMLQDVLSAWVSLGLTQCW